MASVRRITRLAVCGAGAVWRYVRAASGDDAYERYLAHRASHHAHQPIMTRKAFFMDRQRQKWSGVTRCC
jgi:uncharacterized short protein YbdD (DUF466 family)